MKTAVMTDTNSGITVEEGKALGVFVLPMPVIVDGKNYLENVDISSQELYRAILSGSDVMTSQPSPDSLMQMWDELLHSGYDSVVHIPMSSGLSGSCETSKLFAAEYGGKVEVADNHRIAVTLRDPSPRRDSWIMMSTALAICSRMARDGRSMPLISSIVSSREMTSRGEFA